jgi:hypothetical protein
VLGLGEEHAGSGHDLLAGGREQDVARAPLDQLDAELGFQLLQLRRQRGLADEARLGRLAEVAVVGDGDEVLEVAEVQAPEPMRRRRRQEPTT